MRIEEIIEAINDFAPLSLQESWDNSGLQVGDISADCTGALLCVDVTPKIFQEAILHKCNLIISHHPLIFKGIKQISPSNNDVQKCIYIAIQNGITVYSSHTALDSASRGISRRMAMMLGAKPYGPLVPGEVYDTGLGCIAEFNPPLNCVEFVNRVKSAFGSSVVRGSRAFSEIRRLALCGGSGGEFIPRALEAGCDAYLTSDVRYHDFVDYGKRIFIADIGHFESEECSKQIFYDIISEKFPNFAVYKSEIENNSIIYI